MRKKLAILTVLTLIMGIVAPFSVLANDADDGTALYTGVDDGTALYNGVRDELYYSNQRVDGAAGISTIPISPVAEATKNLNTLVPKRGYVYKYEEDGSVALNGEGDPIYVDWIRHLEATEKSTYAEPDNTRLWRTMSYTYVMDNPRNPRNYSEGN